MVKTIRQHPLLLDKIEKMMLFLSNETDVTALTKRRVEKHFFGKLGKQAFIDLYSLTDYRETILRENVVSGIYFSTLTQTVDSIERMMPPQYQVFIVQRAVAANAEL